MASTLELPTPTSKQLVSKKEPAIYILREGEIYPKPILPNTPRNQKLINAVKRGASGPIVTTSDEESDGCPSPRAGNINNNNNNTIVSNNNNSNYHGTINSHLLNDKERLKQQAFEAYEHDHDYENPTSPSGSSTASGPIYERQPGFKHHAHEVKKVKKKKTQDLLHPGYVQTNNRLKKRAPTPPKVRFRRDSLPMKQRALPQSFWRQPNIPNQSPVAFPSLPPLCSKDTGEDVADIRPITPPEEREARQKQKQLSRQPEKKLIIGDTDLLQKLFIGVQSEDQKTGHQHKRGRPRKVTVPKATNTKALITDDDPFLMETISDKLFPNLHLETRQAQAGSTMLQLVTLKEGDKSVTLPSLSHEQNYSQMLSEITMNI